MRQERGKGEVNILLAGGLYQGLGPERLINSSAYNLFLAGSPFFFTHWVNPLVSEKLKVLSFYCIWKGRLHYSESKRSIHLTNTGFSPSYNPCEAMELATMCLHKFPTAAKLLCNSTLENCIVPFTNRSIVKPVLFKPIQVQSSTELFLSHLHLEQPKR